MLSNNTLGFILTGPDISQKRINDSMTCGIANQNLVQQCKLYTTILLYL